MSGKEILQLCAVWCLMLGDLFLMGVFIVLVLISQKGEENALRH